MRVYWSKSLCSKGGGQFEPKFQENGSSSTNDCWRKKARVPDLSRGVVCVILRLAVLVQYRRVTDGRMDRRTRDVSKYRASIASRG